MSYDYYKRQYFLKRGGDDSESLYRTLQQLYKDHWHSRQFPIQLPPASPIHIFQSEINFMGKVSHFIFSPVHDMDGLFIRRVYNILLDPNTVLAGTSSYTHGLVRRNILRYQRLPEEEQKKALTRFDIFYAILSELYDTLIEAGIDLETLTKK